MKVLFIIQPSPFLIDQRVFPNLGILKVAAVCGRPAVLDLSGDMMYLERVVQSIEEVKPTHIGLTATTPQVPYVLEISKMIRCKYPHIHQIIGGSHATMVCSNTAGDRSNHNQRVLIDHFETVVVGFGESVIEEILSTNKIGIVESYKCLPIAPERELIDLSSYHYTIDGRYSTSIVTTTGCPFKCGFCGGRSSVTYNHAIFMDIDAVIEEIDYLYKRYRCTGFMFYDDEFNLNRKRTMLLLDALTKYQRDNNTEFSLRGFTRANMLTPDMAKAMSVAGFKWLLAGFESGNNTTLQSMEKGCTVDMNTECVSIAKEAGLKVKALMSIGHPGESHSTTRDTETWLKKVNPDEVDVTVVAAYPGSAYYDKAKCYRSYYMYTAPNGNRLFIDDIDINSKPLYYKGMNGQYVSHVFTDNMTKEDLISERERIHNQWIHK